MPDGVKNSTILTGNELAILASYEKIPEKQDCFERENKNDDEKHALVKELIQNGDPDQAWQILL